MAAALPGDGGGFFMAAAFAVELVFFTLGVVGTAPPAGLDLVPAPPLLLPLLPPLLLLLLLLGIGAPGFHPGHPGRGSVGPLHPALLAGLAPFALLLLLPPLPPDEDLVLGGEGEPEPPDEAAEPALLLDLEDLVLVELDGLVPTAAAPPVPDPGLHMLHALHWQRWQCDALDLTLQNVPHCSTFESPASWLVHLAGGGGGGGDAGGLQYSHARHWHRAQ